MKGLWYAACPSASHPELYLDYAHARLCQGVLLPQHLGAEIVTRWLEQQFEHA